ncbi:MAG: hypothetical protein K2P45_09095 [Eubacterium sp.]|nr:hypothetical protein [Eubacterium sp.]
MKADAQKIKVKVEFTEGYQRRFTEACCRALKRREKRQTDFPGETEKEPEQLVL